MKVTYVQFIVKLLVVVCSGDSDCFLDLTFNIRTNLLTAGGFIGEELVVDAFFFIRVDLSLDIAAPDPNITADKLIRGCSLYINQNMCNFSIADQNASDICPDIENYRNHTYPKVSIVTFGLY